MAGIAVPNLPTFFRDSALRAARAVEVPNADFTDGCNDAGSNAPGIGINSGDYDPKPSDWPRINMADPSGSVAESQQIGEDKSGINLTDGTAAVLVTAFVQATGEVAPGGQVAVAAGFAVDNLTGKTVPANSWLWAVGVDTG